jgi:hypothetical protein
MGCWSWQLTKQRTNASRFHLLVGVTFIGVAAVLSTGNTTARGAAIIAGIQGIANVGRSVWLARLERRRNASQGPDTV